MYQSQIAVMSGAPNSSDLSPLDYYVWAIAKIIVTYTGSP